MKRIPILTIALLLLPAAAAIAGTPDIVGDWQGTLRAGGGELRLVLHIAKADDGSLKSTLDSIDQASNGIPVASTTLKGSSLHLDVVAVFGKYDGNVASDGKRISGTWSQGADLPLEFERAAATAYQSLKPTDRLSLKRPQDPVKPYPYHEEDLTYENKVQNVRLAATLTTPTGKGPFTAVLLITGSGPQDRDESLLGHKPFLILSDYLTRHGIAVLRADDRGTAKSTGDFSKATTADFATDVEAGVAYLKTRPEINPHKIGLIGHSEGGVIAPMVAARNRDVAFIVMMAGTGVPGDQVLPAQVEALALASGKSADEAAKLASGQREILTLVESEKDETALDAALRAKMAGTVPEALVGMQIEQLTSPWFRYFITYDPAGALRHVTCPVLAIDGSLDRQVLPAQNLPAIRAALKAAGNTHAEVDELPGLNHLFQTARTGSPSEYANIEETMSPLALEKMASWIARQ